MKEDSLKPYEIDPNRPITQDWRKRAEDELGETVAVRESAVVEFRRRVNNLPDMVPRVDDAFLTRFLRAKKYDQEKALRMYRNYFRVRLLDPTVYCPVGKGPNDFVHLYKFGVGYLLKHRNPINGACIIVWQFGDWTPETGYDLSHIYTPTQFAVDFALNDPEVQLNGFMFLVNLIGMEWRFMKVFGVNAVRVSFFGAGVNQLDSVVRWRAVRKRVSSGDEKKIPQSHRQSRLMDVSTYRVSASSRNIRCARERSESFIMAFGQGYLSSIECSKVHRRLTVLWHTEFFHRTDVRIDTS